MVHAAHNHGRKLVVNENSNEIPSRVLVGILYQQAGIIQDKRPQRMLWWPQHTTIGGDLRSHDMSFFCAQ